jgi:hypothetical protein
MYLFPQELGFLLSFSRSGSQVDILFGLAPTGTHNCQEGNAVSREGDEDDTISEGSEFVENIELEGKDNEVNSEDEVNFSLWF